MGGGRLKVYKEQLSKNKAGYYPQRSVNVYFQIILFRFYLFFILINCFRLLFLCHDEDFDAIRIVVAKMEALANSFLFFFYPIFQNSKLLVLRQVKYG